MSESTNQAKIIFSSLSTEVQNEMIEFVKSMIPKEPICETVRFDIPGETTLGYVEGFVNAKIASKFVGVSDRVFYEMVGRGEIPFYKASGQMRFRLSELANAIKQEKKTN